MTFIPNWLISFLVPLSSPFLAVFIVLALPLVRNPSKHHILRILFIPAIIVLFFLLYFYLADIEGIEKWLARLNLPLIPVLLGLVIPAMLLPRNKWYPVFLILPAGLLILSVLSVIGIYSNIPEANKGFYWCLISPSMLLAGITSLLVLVQPLLSLKHFRSAVRVSAFLMLMYGGFMFRSSYQDYKEMLSRRTSTDPGQAALLMETTPVLKTDQQIVHIPGAPCRFSADGGYVQGCNLELWQRLMQTDISKILKGDPGETYAITVVLGAATLFFALSFVSGRWWCGWICPLSSIGAAFDWLRQKLGFRHFKQNKKIQTALFASGISLAGFSLLLAKLYTHLDESGCFLGCKIPVYPFCKICPGQQICPVASKGPGAFPPQPARDWLFGFFSIAAPALLVLFIVGFLCARRIWCRFCPMGMLPGIFNRGGALTLRKRSVKCNQCGVCSEVCPVDIDSVRSEMEDSNVGSFSCLMCLKCIEKCPQDNCLSLEYAHSEIVTSRFRTE